MNIIWLGHSGFRIEIENAVLLVDPWLTGNPMFPADQRAHALKGATHVLLTHGHGDHAGDALAIAKELNIPLVGIYDLLNGMQKRDGLSVIGFNKGGTVDLNGAKVTLVNASHSSSVIIRIRRADLCRVRGGIYDRGRRPHHLCLRRYRYHGRYGLDGRSAQTRYRHPVLRRPLHHGYGPRRLCGQTIFQFQNRDPLPLPNVSACWRKTPMS